MYKSDYDDFMIFCVDFLINLRNFLAGVDQSNDLCSEKGIFYGKHTFESHQTSSFSFIMYFSLRFWINRRKNRMKTDIL